MLQLMKFGMILAHNMEYWWYIVRVNLTNVEHDITHLPLLSLVCFFEKLEYQTSGFYFF
jgi:hypothetical protein